MCAITRLKGVILIGESPLYCLVQEPSSYVIPGLRYEGKYKSRSTIGTVRYLCRDGYVHVGVVQEQNRWLPVWYISDAFLYSYTKQAINKEYNDITYKV